MTRSARQISPLSQNTDRSGLITSISPNSTGENLLRRGKHFKIPAQPESRYSDENDDATPRCVGTKTTESDTQRFHVESNIELEVLKACNDI